MNFTCGCELRTDGTFSKRCLAHQTEDRLQAGTGALELELERAHNELAQARAELEDVRGQRETLKTECEALRMTLSRKGKSTFPEMVALRAELADVRGQRSVLVMEGEALGRAVQTLRAEVERRGELLRRCSLWVDDQELGAEIESLDHAPANQSQRGTPPRDAD